VGPHTAEQGAADLRRIREDLGDCKRCKLWSHRKNIVFGVGSPAPEICFVGEGPGADEDRVGEPFVGAAGQLLTQMIRAMGFAREEVYICNIVKCRPPNNRDPEMDESSSCLPFVMRQVRAVRPRVIVTLGKTAAWSLLRTNVPISKLRGTWMKYEGIPLMPTFHPSYLLRDVKQKRPVWDDLRAVLRELGRPVPEKPKAGGGPGDAQR
jgi:DNA polymerase